VEVTHVDHMGDDLLVVNAARVSFNKESKSLTGGDEKLIRYLAKHGHWTPFSHCTATFRIKAPIFVARQLFKHKVGLSENEISRRYVDNVPEFYLPTVWRGKADNKKQGSSGKVEQIPYTNWEGNFPIEETIAPSVLADIAYEEALKAYKAMIAGGIAPEQARMVLPQAMYTEWYWTGSMSAWDRVCKLRMSDDAQDESREIAEKISMECLKLWPTSWTALSEV
jgi:thymidylate synthase (FAD)|tara:strand:+ start:7352 stop:8023 length:672 start_codon:yes stop_codon:yes gene_type:complete